MKYDIKIGKGDLVIMDDPKPRKPRPPYMDCYGFIWIPARDDSNQEPLPDYVERTYKDKADCIENKDTICWWYLFKRDNSGIPEFSIEPCPIAEKDGWTNVGYYAISRHACNNTLFNREEDSSETDYEEADYRGLADEEIQWLNDYYRGLVYCYEYTSPDMSEKCSMFYGLDGINSILRHFRLPLSAVEDGLVLHTKSNKMHTKKHIWADCKYIMTKNGIMPMKEK